MSTPTDAHLKALDTARARMLAAKRAFTEAAAAAQRQEPESGRRCAEALEELNAARAELEQLTDQALGLVGGNGAREVRNA